MRLGEECPYITPCGFCSRQGKPCEKQPRHRVDLSALDFSPAAEALKNMSERFKAEAEQMKPRDMAATALIQASTNFLKLDAEQGEPEPPVTVAVPLEEDEAWKQTLSGRRDT